MSISGKDMDLAHAFAGALSGMEFKNLKVEVGNFIGYCRENDTITLPGIPFGDADDELKEDLRAYIAHESIGERGESTWVPKDYNDALRPLVNGMCDARIDRIALEKWPGAGLSIRSRLQKDWQSFAKRAKAGEVGVTDPWAVAAALRYIGENVATPAEVAACSPDLARLIACITPVLDQVDWDGTEAEVIAHARAIRKLIDLDTEKKEKESKKAEAEGKPKEGPPNKGKLSEGGPETETPSKKSKKGLPTGEPQTMEERLKRSIQQRLDPRTATRSDMIFTLPPNSLRHVPANDTDPYETAATADRAMVSRIMRLFHHLQAAEDRVVLKHRLVGELDPDRFADIHRGSQRLFTARKRAITESLAVYISVDLTGSMGGTMHRLRPLLMSLNEALGRLEIPTAIVGWYGTGTTAEWRERYVQPYGTRFVDVKSFDSSWMKARKALSILNTGSANADVPAIAEGISQLARRPESRKLFFFLTDGQPCLDTRPEFDVPNGLLGHTMKTLVEKGRQRGILTVACGVGLGADANRTMTNIFGQDNYARTDASGGIGVEFEKSLKRIVLQQERGIR